MSSTERSLEGNLKGTRQPAPKIVPVRGHLATRTATKCAFARKNVVCRRPYDTAVKGFGKRIWMHACHDEHKRDNRGREPCLLIRSGTSGNGGIGQYLWGKTYCSCAPCRYDQET